MMRLLRSLMGDPREPVREPEQPVPISDPPADEEHCPGHVASAHDAKVCGHCGTHIDSLRPDVEESNPPDIDADSGVGTAALLHLMH